MPLPPSLSRHLVDRSMLVTLAWFSPVEPTRTRYRLAALEALATKGNLQENEEKDDEWKLGMKPIHPNKNLISRGTVWSKRLIQRRKKVSNFSHDATLPIRVQCRDTSGLDPDVQILFAIVVTIELETQVLFDIHKEISDRLLIPVQAQG